MAEKEYIERESAIAEVTMMAEDRRIPVDSYCGEVVGEVIRLLREIPAADVRPVPEGGIWEMSDGSKDCPLSSVVTCGECEYCIKKDEHELWCSGFCNPARLVRKDDFCSHGSRHE